MFFFEPCNFTFSLPLSSFRRPKAVEQLEERIIVPEGTKILLKKVPLTAPNTKNTTAANDVPASNKRVRFSLPSKAFDAVSSDSEDENESSNPRNKRSKTSSKRTTRRGNKASSKGSDSEDEFTVENSSDVEEEEEEEEGGGGLGCSRCGAHQIQSLHEDEETGDMLCDVCQGASGHDGSTSGGAFATIARLLQLQNITSTRSLEEWNVEHAEGIVRLIKESSVLRDCSKESHHQGQYRRCQEVSQERPGELLLQQVSRPQIKDLSIDRLY